MSRKNSKLFASAKVTLGSPETFRLRADGLAIERTIRTRKYRRTTTSLGLTRKLSTKQTLSQDRLAALFDQTALRTIRLSRSAQGKPPVRMADLFSSCGLMTLGVSEACRALGRPFTPVLAIDNSDEALDVYIHNFDVQYATSDSITRVLDKPCGTRPSKSEKSLLNITKKLDIVVAGPPCQGHSSLNNVTRRADPKNELYERVARFAELTRPKNIIVENVPDVLHDTKNVVDRTFQELLSLGYWADHQVVDISKLGLPQRRRRHVLVASLAREISIDKILSSYKRSPRTVGWAIGDLRRRHSAPIDDYDTASKPTAVSLQRMRYLLDRDVYDLPNHLRPECHQNTTHTYKSVYGRLRWDAPAQTITSGFGSMGQGRYVHPAEKRTITPHEAARLQFIPDGFSFLLANKRTRLAELIGNAVPPKLTYVLAVELLRD